MQPAIHAAPPQRLAPEMSIGCCLGINRIQQIKMSDHFERPEGEYLSDYRHQPFIINNASPGRINPNISRIGPTDTVCQSHLNLIAESGCNAVLGNVARHIGSRAINFTRVFARKGTAAMWTTTSVGVHDYFASCHTSIGLWAARNKTARFVNEESGIAVDQLWWQRRSDDLFDQPGPCGTGNVMSPPVNDSLRVLSRQYDRAHPDRTPPIVFNRNLTLTVRVEPFYLSGPTDIGKPADYGVCKHYRQRHQFRCLSAGITKHDALITRPPGVNALGDVRRLTTDGVENRTSICDHPALRCGVADFPQRLADKPRQINIAFSRYLAPNQHHADSDERLTSNATTRVFRQHGIEYRI